MSSITDQGAKSSFSNYGAVSVDLGAPGSAIYSTLPSGTYGSYSGTSMATPHVSGAVALCAAAAPTFTASDIRSMLIATSALTASLANITTTGARLDAGTLAASCASGAAPAPDTTAPSAPSDLSGTAAGSSTVSLAWSAATDDRGVAGYRIWRSSDSGRVQLADVVGTSATDSGLSAATTYTYEVAAFDAAGNVGPSVSAQVTTGSAVLPGAFGKSAPADGATGLGTTVTLSWSTSTGASSYLVCVDTVDDGACNATWTSVGTALKATLRASRTRTYFWQVRAANAAGTTDADGGRWWRLTTR